MRVHCFGKDLELPYDHFAVYVYGQGNEHFTLHPTQREAELVALTAQQRARNTVFLFQLPHTDVPAVTVRRAGRGRWPCVRREVLEGWYEVFRLDGGIRTNGASGK